jgi:hypothetical protein
VEVLVPERELEEPELELELEEPVPEDPEPVPEVDEPESASSQRRASASRDADFVEPTAFPRNAGWRSANAATQHAIAITSQRAIFLQGRRHQVGQNHRKGGRGTGQSEQLSEPQLDIGSIHSIAPLKICLSGSQHMCKFDVLTSAKTRNES